MAPSLSAYVAIPLLLVASHVSPPTFSFPLLRPMFGFGRTGRCCRLVGAGLAGLARRGLPHMEVYRRGLLRFLLLLLLLLLLRPGDAWVCLRCRRAT